MSPSTAAVIVERQRMRTRLHSRDDAQVRYFRSLLELPPITSSNVPNVCAVGAAWTKGVHEGVASTSFRNCDKNVSAHQQKRKVQLLITQFKWPARAIPNDNVGMKSALFVGWYIHKSVHAHKQERTIR